jgi:hypothetical protein
MMELLHKYGFYCRVVYPILDEQETCIFQTLTELQCTADARHQMLRNMTGIMKNDDLKELRSLLARMMNIYNLSTNPSIRADAIDMMSVNVSKFQTGAFSILPKECTEEKEKVSQLYNIFIGQSRKLRRLINLRRSRFSLKV